METRVGFHPFIYPSSHLSIHPSIDTSIHSAIHPSLCLFTGADPGFWKGGGAWGVGDKLAVRSSQVCAPGGSEGMPPRNF